MDRTRPWETLAVRDREYRYVGPVKKIIVGPVLQLLQRRPMSLVLFSLL